MQRIMCLVIVAALPALVVGGDDDARKELKALQGSWKVVSIEAEGKALPRDAFPAFTWVIADDGATTARMPAGDFPVTLSVSADPKSKLKTFVNLHGSGDQERKKQYGIYKIEGDKLTVCQTQPGAVEGDRPTDFGTKGTANHVIVFERIKEK